MMKNIMIDQVVEGGMTFFHSNIENAKKYKPFVFIFLFVILFQFNYLIKICLYTYLLKIKN
jgi:hypothetical protein